MEAGVNIRATDIQSQIEEQKREDSPNEDVVSYRNYPTMGGPMQTTGSPFPASPSVNHNLG